MQYYNNGLTYTGFCEFSGPALLKPESIVVMVWCYGQVSLWLAESQDGIRQLAKMYTDQWGQNQMFYQALKQTMTPDQLQNLVGGKWADLNK
jgi:hypothetical protein